MKLFSDPKYTARVNIVTLLETIEWASEIWNKLNYILIMLFK